MGDEIAGTSGTGAGGTGEAGTGTTEQPKAFKVEDLPDEARAYLRAQVADAEAKARTTSKANAAKEARDAVLAEFAQKLGLAPDDKPDVGKLNDAVTAASRRADAAVRERDAIKAARNAGGDDEIMIDSSSFLAELHKLDVSSDTYKADLAKLVTDSIEGNPRFKAATARPNAGTGAGGEFGKRVPDNGADDGSVESMAKTLGYV